MLQWLELQETHEDCQTDFPKKVDSRGASDDQLSNQFPSQLLHDIRQEAFDFQGGRFTKFVDKWAELTQDKEILHTVHGIGIEFADVEEPLAVRKPTAKIIRRREKDHKL